MTSETPCDLEVNWLITDFCNLRCRYCYPGSKKNKYIGFPDIQKISDGFDNTGSKWLIYISGGEPFLFPGFIELCQKLTARHIISVNTNLTHQDIYRFADTIAPEKTRCVHCSLHIQERKRLHSVKDFIKKYKMLEEKGFYVYASYVLYPPLLRRFKQDYEHFKSEGIIIRPKLFRGVYSKWDIKNARFFWRMQHLFEKTYPDAYTKEQKQAILSYMDNSQQDGNFCVDHKEDIHNGRLSDVYLDKLLIDHLPSYKGSYCLTGKTFVRMTPTGDTYRCYDEDRYLGNLFEGNLKLFEKPAVCASNVCSCPYIGHRHLIREKINNG